MAAPKTVNRVIQYWQILEGSEHNRFDELNWFHVLGILHGQPRRAYVEGRELTGVVSAVDVPEQLQGFLATVPDGAPSSPDSTTTYGLVLSEPKDYVPNQQQRSDGAFQSMELAGAGWDPVDNLYIWFCPFGNMFATLAESNSSPRAGIFAAWLSKVLADLAPLKPNADGSSRDLFAEPVIDKDRIGIMDTVHGLRNMTVAGHVGQTSVPARGIAQMFGGQSTVQGALRVEVKVSLVRGISGEDDQEQLKGIFDHLYSDRAGDVLKAQVTTAPEDELPATEIDLLNHRLTRSTKIPLRLTETSAFEAPPTFRRMITAFGQDHKDLLRIRHELWEIRQ
ncbi:hypothetical protein ACTXOR_08820 [Arthrobacter rhombi]|uniref:hypothetical protein n=1 Tax=Arthrobacter rhombi TaxID=71253 RepID=UPI003FD677D0